MSTKIAFTDFWDGFDPNRNFFTGLFGLIDNVRVVSPDECDILIFSCFGSRNMKFNDKKKIFYTGENLRPNYDMPYIDSRGFFVGKCDFSFSFDINDDERNIRVPLWIIQIDWFNQVGYGNPQFVMPYEKLMNNDFLNKEKSKFCSFVFNSNAPYRYEIIEELSKYKEVDCFGKPHKNKIPYGELNKLNAISDYRFNLCFENSLSPGYYTEKLIHAKYAGCIPIYWSDIGVGKEFNSDSILNLSNYNSVKDMCEHIIEIDKSETQYRALKEKPMFKDEQDPILMFNSIIEKVKKII
jgi:hypothetical protein